MATYVRAWSTSYVSRWYFYKKLWFRKNFWYSNSSYVACFIERIVWTLALALPPSYGVPNLQCFVCIRAYAVCVCDM
jgi:hypothetical protein